MSVRGYRITSILVLVFLQSYDLPELAASNWATVMRDLGVTFRQIEETSANRRFDAIPLLSQKLFTNVRSLGNSRSDRQAAVSGGFQIHLREIENAARQLHDAAVRNDQRRVSLSVEQIRRQCVSCHAGYRRFTSLAGFYPARGNTVIAKVAITNVDGRPKQDHSNVVVFLDGAIRGGSPPLSRGNPRVSQKNRRYEPRVLPIVKGTVVDFPNDDTILHNVFSLSKARRFDLDVYQPGQSKSVRFPKPGLVRLFCNIHPEMVCSILVLNNSFFALSNRDGNCLITGIPDGEFAFRTWHESGGQTRHKVSLRGNMAVRVPVQVKEQRRSLTHTNKYGRQYPEAKKKY